MIKNIKKILVCSYGLIFASLHGVTNGIPNELSHELAQSETEQKTNIVEEPVNSNVPSFEDTFIGFEDEQLLASLEKFEAEQNPELTFSEKVQLAFAYLKACSIETRKNIAQHLQTHYRQYFLGASLATIVLAVWQLARLAQRHEKH